MSENSKIEPTTLAYLAGMIDGDGYITINRSQRGRSVYHGPQIGIAGTRREPHDLAASLWAARCPATRRPIPGTGRSSQWSRQGAAAVQIIELLLPCLLIKREHAELALQLWEHIEEGKSDDPFPWFSSSYDPVLARDEMRADMIDLNQSRNRVGKKAAGRLLDGREWNGVPS